MTMDAVTLQIISNILVFIGVVVAIITIIYNVKTAKKRKLLFSFLKAARTGIILIRSICLKGFISQVNHSAPMCFQAQVPVLLKMKWKSAGSFNTF